MREGDTQWGQALADKIHEKVLIVAARTGEKIPYTAIDGRFDDHTRDINWWTNGFYAGQLWQLFHAYGEDMLRDKAQAIEQKLDRGLMEHQGMDHDSGFKWLLTAVADYRMTGSAASRNRGLLAADHLAGRLNLAGRFIRAWNSHGGNDNTGWAIIDCMMNLPLLYWASEETGDPRYRQIAMAHADTAMAAFVREDGSVCHIVRFDPETGERIDSLGGQGMGVGTSWTRGQAWGLYGFTLSALHTGKVAYLDTARRIARYVAGQIPPSGLMPVDFCQDASCPWEDATAAAIAACGFLALEKQGVPPEEAELFHATAMGLLHTLAERRCNWAREVDPIVEGCSAAYHDARHNFPIIYGDYFLTEAALRLCGREIFLW